MKCEMLRLATRHCRAEKLRTGEKQLSGEESLQVLSFPVLFSQPFLVLSASVRRRPGQTFRLPRGQRRSGKGTVNEIWKQTSQPKCNDRHKPTPGEMMT